MVYNTKTAHATPDPSDWCCVFQANQTIAPDLPSMFRYNYAIQWHYENMLLTIAPNQSDLKLVRVLILCK